MVSFKLLFQGDKQLKGTGLKTENLTNDNYWNSKKQFKYLQELTKTMQK